MAKSPNETPFLDEAISTSNLDPALTNIVEEESSPDVFPDTDNVNFNYEAPSDEANSLNTILSSSESASNVRADSLLDTSGMDDSLNTSLDAATLQGSNTNAKPYTYNTNDKEDENDMVWSKEDDSGSIDLSGVS